MDILPVSLEDLRSLMDTDPAGTQKSNEWAMRRYTLWAKVITHLRNLMLDIFANFQKQLLETFGKFQPQNMSNSNNLTTDPEPRKLLVQNVKLMNTCTMYKDY